MVYTDSMVVNVDHRTRTYPALDIYSEVNGIPFRYREGCA